jgi:N-acetylglucosamine repressor
MSKTRTGNNKFLKIYNEKQILNLIRVNKAVSRSELSQLTGLSPTATGAVVSALIEKGYICEIGEGQSKGGRRPVLLELAPGSFYSVGLDVDVNYIKIAMVDITGEVVYEKSVPPGQGTEFESTANYMRRLISEAIDSCSIGSGKLLGIGISVPGMIDSDTQKVLLAPNLGWKDVDIKPTMEDAFKAPIYLENEAMASAICENWLGACRDVNNFVCVNVKSGIGAGIFTDGRPYRGAGGSAGEIGHILVEEDGPRCGCGNYGCLETVASTTRIVEKAKKLVRQGTVSRLNNFKDLNEITIDSIVDAARNGDETAMNILNESARYLGIAISSIVNMLNPSRIVIGKEFVKYADLVIDKIKSIVSCKALRTPASKVEVISSQMGERASALGAAIIPLKVFFGK